MRSPTAGQAVCTGSPARAKEAAPGLSDQLIQMCEKGVRGEA